MNFGILNEKHAIMVFDGIENLGHLQTEQIKQCMPEGTELKALVFFYMPDRDWIVLNREHTMYDFYSETLPVYLELSTEERQECKEQAPVKSIKEAWKMLDDIIFRRSLLHGKAV